MAVEDLEARVSALEEQVRELAGRVRDVEQDAAAARVLAGGADRDVTETRAEIRDFRQAAVSGLSDLRTRVNDQFAEVHNGFAEMRGKLAAAAAGQARILTLVTTLVERSDRR